LLALRQAASVQGLIFVALIVAYALVGLTVDRRCRARMR